jgi:integrase
VEKLIAAQPALRDQVALMLLAWLGLRKGELRALRIADFNLAARTVTVHGKGGHEDKLPLGFERLRTALELHLVERERHPDEFLLYPKTFRTRPMDPASWLKRCLRLAGLPLDVQTHELRHTAARLSIARRATSCSRNNCSATPTSARRGATCAPHKNVCARLWPSSRHRGSSALAFSALLRA